MKGSRKTRKGISKKAAPSPAQQKPAAAEPDCDLTPARQPTVASPLQTPRRSTRQRAQLTSTPLSASSTDAPPSSSPQSKQVGAKSHRLTTQPEASEADAPALRAERRSRRRLDLSSTSKQIKRKAQEQKQTAGEAEGPPAKRQPGRKKKTETSDSKQSIQAQASERIRPRFELRETDSAEQEEESLLSSDLSIELSQHEEQLPCLSLQEEEESDEEEEEELPSFLMQVDKKPITEGGFVWHKFRHYPFWPALVKSVNRKQKKASIMFIDYSIFEKTRGFTVALKSLKPFDCEEANEIILEAKEQYNAVISWSLDLIKDYRIRIACGSFSGSFVEYVAHDMSYPVRRKYPQETSERLNIASDAIMLEEPCDDLKAVSIDRQQEEVSRGSKRLLPDRTQAAHNRANEKLVHFIVKLRMVEGHLLAVIGGQQQSRWLRSFLSANRRRLVNTYLEDDQQIDKVYQYLSELYATARVTAPCLAAVKSIECVSFVLEVLLPEAIIYAIAGVDNVSVKKAEEKYLKGRLLSNRETQELHQMIEKLMKKKHQSTTLALPDHISKNTGL